MSEPRRRHRFLKVLLIIVIVIVIIRIALPFVLVKVINKQMASMDGYHGHINDIDLALLRGAYKIDSIYVNKVDSVSQKETPFFAASMVDLSVEWNSLIHGSVAGEITLFHPMLRFTKDKVEPKDVVKDTVSLQEALDKLMPLQINRFEVKDGNIQYIDEFSKPKVDIAMTNVFLVAHNLRNKYDSGSVLPASINATADIYGGTLALNMKLNPLAEYPTFDMNAELKKTHLVKVNDFFKAYAKIDVNKGTFGLYTEVAAKDGKFEGYVKPVIEDLDVLGQEDRKDNIFQKAWEAVSGAVGKVLENKPHDQVATKVPFQGTLKGSDTNIWVAISSILQNAFIRAIQPAIDNQINLATVDNAKQEKKTFLEKVFGKKDDKKKDEKKKEEKN